MLGRYRLQFETAGGEIVPELPEWWVGSTVVALGSDERDAVKLLETEYCVMLCKLEQKAKWKLVPVDEIPVPIMVKQTALGCWANCEAQPHSVKKRGAGG